MYLSLYEEETPVIEEEKGAFCRIGESFVKNLKDIGNALVEIFVFVVGALPYFVLFGGIGVGIFYLYRFIKKRPDRKTSPTPPTAQSKKPEDTSSKENDTRSENE